MNIMGNPQHYPPPQARHGGRGSSAPPFSLSLSRQQNVMIIVGVEVARESVTVNGRGRPSERVVAADQSWKEHVKGSSFPIDIEVKLQSQLLNH